MRIKNILPKQIVRQPWVIYQYIFMEVSKPFLGAALFFLFVLMMFQVVKLSDFFIIHNVSGGSILYLLSYLSLTFTPVILPIAFLLAVLLGMGRLSTDSEILAMRSAGLSIYKMMVPVVFLGTVLSLVTLFCNLYFVPYGSKMFRYELFRISNTKAIATIHEGTFTEGFFDLVVYANKVNTRQNIMYNVLIYDESKSGPPITIVAKSGKIINDLRDGDGTPGLILRLFDGSLNRSTPEKELYEQTNFKIYDIFLRIETAKVIGVDVPKTMDISVLKKRLDELDEVMAQGTTLEKMNPMWRLDYINYGVEYWKRYALSFSCLIFSILGVGFGVIRTRTVRSSSFLLCILVLMVYWMLYSLGHNLASEGKVSALIGMWWSNVILAIVAIFTIRRVSR
ncbi:MAG: LPS export ABC transporter permease LptF [Oligoflexia bacterium]|nr:LPS export ABC transporter permease LptF [Oligoflexia bacterium]